jgi:hypothetical protein
MTSRTNERSSRLTLWILIGVGLALFAGSVHVHRLARAH